MRIPLVSLVHHCRFRYWKTKRKTCIQGAKRPTNEFQRGGKQGHRCFRKGGQTYTVQPWTQGNTPDTFQGYLVSLIFRPNQILILVFLFKIFFISWYRSTTVWYNDDIFSKPAPVICTSISSQSVWNIITPVRIGLGQVKGSFFQTVGGGGVRLIFKVDELVGNRWKISQCTCNRGWSGVHTNRGNKVLLVQTPGIKMAGPFACCMVRQLQVGNI